MLRWKTEFEKRKKIVRQAGQAESNNTGTRKIARNAKIVYKIVTDGKNIIFPSREL